ncbi:MAG: relaxase/mobilization nuclease domain-containing protein [Saprospiraceae bacterium]|nr:relaxase/mobilization nuclease domain-containing protein [Candidatus Vicinibacter affinis]MBK8642379.1 relaxase/mobilization nuclease domain-containing protein [Candidatus Vicinibacter affinis]MBK9640042.1 relaxase/mobilization nuclease domain-containing protein [Candidatus Vicinibacter affinis]
MILKNLTRRSNTGQLVNYLFKQEKDNYPKPVLKHNLKSHTTKGWTKELNNNFELRLNKRKDNIRLHHTIISFSNKDKKQINPELLKDITKKYIELRGKDNIYLASSHHDKEHIHLHIVMSSTKLITGESNRISRQEFRDLKLALDEYQKEKYPELVNSLPAHGKSQKLQLSDPELKLQVWQGKLSEKQELFQTVETVYNQSKSVDNFLSELKSEGINSYSRGGKVYGVEDESGKHYRFKTLGFELKKLEELDRQTQEEAKQLQELASLRDSKSPDRAQDNNGFERGIEDDNEDWNEDLESDDSEEET